MINPFAAAGAAWVSPSLNRVRIVGLPEELLPPELNGLLAYELLSKPALERLINARADELKLDLARPDTDPVLAFDRCFFAESPSIRHAAADIAREYGRRLGLLALTLKLASAASRATRAEWGPEHWNYWRAINNVWLGGGLLAGWMGPIAVRQGRELLRRAGCRDIRLRLAEDPGNLALRGAARYASGAVRKALLFDFGQTRVKRACAIYDGGLLVDVIRFPALKSPCQDHVLADATMALARQHMNDMLQIMVQTWEEAQRIGLNPDRLVIASLACHMDHGQPYPSELGCYGSLQLIADDLPHCLSEALGRFLGLSVEIKLIQDGTAAASLLAGQPQTAVIMLGTALGIGFPPAVGGLLPLAHSQRILEQALP